MPIIAYPRIKREFNQNEIDQEAALSKVGQELYQRLGALADKEIERISPREGDRGWLDRVWAERVRGDFTAKTKGILIAADIVELDENQDYRSVISDSHHSIVGLDANGYLIPPGLNYLLEPIERAEIMDRIDSTVDALEAVAAPTQV